MPPPAAGACASVVFFEQGIYFGNYEPELKVGPAIGEGTRPDGCNDTVTIVDGVTVEQPPVPLRSVTVRRVVGKSPAIAVAIEGDADTLFVYDRRAPAGIAAAEPGGDGFIRVALLMVALIVLAGAGLLVWWSRASV